MDLFEAGYIGLFLASFLSATIIPLSSEGILILMLYQGFNPIGCLAVATTGNSLGSFTNLLIGRLGNPLWLKRFGMSEKRLIKFQDKIQKYGFWLGLISWIPLIGDPLTIALGFFRVSLWKVMVLVVLGKLVRYLLIIYFFTL